MNSVKPYQQLAGPGQIWSSFTGNLGTGAPTKLGVNSTMAEDTYNSKMKETVSHTYDMIDSQFINNESIKSYKQTEDYKKHKLVPGQRLATGNAFGVKGTGLSHHVVYIGNGLIYEMAPLSENKRLRKGPNVKLGLSNLYEWIQNANKKESPVFMIDDKQLKIDSKSFMIGMFKRLHEKIDSGARANQLGPFHNCESEANYITRGKQETYQGQIILKTIAVAIVGAREIPKLVEDKKCYTRYVTEKGNPCIQGTKDKTVSGKGYCYVDPYSKKSTFRQEKKVKARNTKIREGKIKKTRGKLTKRRYRLTKKKNTFEMTHCPGGDLLDEPGFLKQALSYFTESKKPKKQKKQKKRKTKTIKTRKSKK